MKYNIWNKWDPIETVVLGTTYDPDYFDVADKPRAMDALKRISDETQQELDYFQTVLKDFGAEVLRPNMDPKDRMSNYVGDNQTIPRSALQPRDSQLVIGNNLYYTGHHDHPAIKECLDAYESEWFDFATLPQTELTAAPTKTMSREKYEVYAGYDWPTYEDYVAGNFDGIVAEEVEAIKSEMLAQEINLTISAPNITVVGKDLYVDDLEANFALVDPTWVITEEQKEVMHQVSQDYFEYLEKRYPDFRINRVYIGGHNDATFHTIKPGAILSLNEIQTYTNTFPNWDVCYLPDQSWGKVFPFLQLKKKNKGKWWVPGEESNDEFTNFVEEWLGQWVGYVEESVFDVNVFVLDEHHVCVNNLNTQVVEFLKKHKMEPVHVPWRHRYFWDGGLHCVTLDLKRRGVQKDYFPERTGPVTDGGF